MVFLRTILILWFFIAASVHASPIFDCTKFLKTDRSKSVQEFLSGGTIHENTRAHWAFDEQEIAELEIPALFQLLNASSYTLMGSNRLLWTLSHPRLDSDAIRAVQVGTMELHSNVALKTAIKKELTEIRNYEKRTTKLDLFYKAILKLVHLNPELEERSIPTHFTQFNKKESWAQQLYSYFNAFGLPGLAAYTFGVPGHANISSGVSALMMSNVGRQLQFRRALGQFKSVINASANLIDPLRNSNSAYLKELGEILVSVRDSKHELQLNKPAQYVKTLITNPILARPLDLTLVSNLTLYPKVRQVRNELHKFAVVASVLAELDVLNVFEGLLEKSPTYKMPTILDGDQPLQVRIKNGMNPLIYMSGAQTVPNDLNLGTDANDTQIAFITGLNARGKSTQLRMAAQLTVLAQAGAPVPAEEMTMTPLVLLTAMKKGDSTVDAESTFRSEARRVAELLTASQKYPRNLILLDEVFTGTSAEEKIAAEEALLQYVQSQKYLSIVSSHNRALTTLEGKIPGFRNFHASDSDETKFKIETGPSKRRNAFKVMSEEGLPRELIQSAFDHYKGSLDELEEPIK